MTILRKRLVNVAQPELLQRARKLRFPAAEQRSRYALCCKQRRRRGMIR